jgi:hypothetical protein
MQFESSNDRERPPEPKGTSRSKHVQSVIARLIAKRREGQEQGPPRQLDRDDPSNSEAERSPYKEAA